MVRLQGIEMLPIDNIIERLFGSLYKFGMKKYKWIIMNKIKNHIGYQIIVFVVCCLLLFSVYISLSERMEQKAIANKVLSIRAREDYSVFVDIEKIKTEKNEEIITGWVLREDSINIEGYLSLMSSADGEEIVLETKMYEREDVENYFDPGGEYGTVGILSVVEKNKKNTCYEIYVSLFYEPKEKIEGEERIIYKRKVATGYYLYNNELFTYNPEKFVTPSIDSMDYQEIIKFGKVCSYIDETAWIYEYQRRLYWIIDFSMLQPIEAYPKIPIFIYTTQNKMLSEEMQDSGREYIEYYLTQDDYENKVAERYFIYSLPLEFDFPITYIKTGIYQGKKNNREWSWKTSFRINEMERTEQ